jgi:hypothetical protein
VLERRVEAHLDNLLFSHLTSFCCFFERVVASSQPTLVLELSGTTLSNESCLSPSFLLSLPPFALGQAALFKLKLVGRTSRNGEVDAVRLESRSVATLSSSILSFSTLPTLSTNEANRPERQ